MSDVVLYSKEDHIGWIVLNRLEAMNALNYAMVDALDGVLNQARGDEGVRVVILTGQGDKSFMAGSDIKELMERTTLSGWDNSQKRQQVFSRFDNLGKPTIAAVNGYAFGAGCELACSCSLRIASERAKFGQLEINLGIIPGAGGTQRLPRLVGKGRALELLLTGKVIDAQEAFRIGLVNKIVPHEDLREEAEKLARSLVEKSPVALRSIIQAVNDGLQTSLDNGYTIESGLFSVCLSSEDAREGMSAFVEKRKPTYQGK